WVTDDGKQSAEIQPAGEDKTYRLAYTDQDGKKAPLIGRLGKVGELTVAEFHADDPAPDSSDVYKVHLLPLYTFLIVHQPPPNLGPVRRLRRTSRASALRTAPLRRKSRAVATAGEFFQGSPPSENAPCATPLACRPVPPGTGRRRGRRRGTSGPYPASTRPGP